jgi:hypothetical protein
MLNWRDQSGGGSALTHYVRFRIFNSGKAAARDVEVAVTSVKKRNAAGDSVPLNMGTPWNLLWAHYNQHVLPQLPVQAERHITIGHIVDPAERPRIRGEDDPSRSLPPGQTLFCLEFFVRSNTLEYLLDPGEYEIRLQVSAANSRPRELSVYLNHRGMWFDDETRMYRDALGVRLTY